jgi:hypothetical protein
MGIKALVVVEVSEAAVVLMEAAALVAILAIKVHRWEPAPEHHGMIHTLDLVLEDVQEPPGTAPIPAYLLVKHPLVKLVLVELEPL